MNVNEIREKYSEEEILKIKKNSREIPAYAGDSLENVVLKLESLRRQGKLNCFVNFNGTKLYSIDVTMDSAYRECLGCSRKTWLKRKKKSLEEARITRQKLEKEAQEKLPLWIEQGKKYIHPEKFSNWEKTCVNGASGDYCGLEIERALEIIEMLENGESYHKIKEKIIRDGHSGRTYAKTMSIVLLYAKKGPAFFAFMNIRSMSEEYKRCVTKLKSLNQKLDNGETYDDACNELLEHKIMEISLSGEFLSNGNSNTYFNGTILINKDLSFEGIIYHSYIYGKLINDNVICFATFSNYRVSSYYYGILKDNKIIGAHKVNSVDMGVFSMELSESSKNFADEIALESRIQSIKGKFNEDVKKECENFVENIDQLIQQELPELQITYGGKNTGDLGQELSALVRKLTP